MKKLVCFLVLVLVAGAILAADRQALNVDLQSVPLRDFAKMVYGEILKRSYVIDSSMLNNQDLVSVSLRNVPAEQIEVELAKVLEAHGFVVDQVKGVASIHKRDDTAQDQETFVYRPLHRSTQYLLDLVSTLFKQGSFTTQRQGAAVNLGQVAGTFGQAQPLAPQIANQGINTMTNADVDVLVFRGSSKDVERLRKVLSQVDMAAGELLVKAVVYEVQTTKKEGSAVDLAVSLASGKLGIKIDGSAAAGANHGVVKMTGKGIDVSAVYSALSSDDRFKDVATPRVRIRSGGSARFSVGNVTPVLGAVSYDQNGRAVQSVDYKPSGVIFELKPQVREESVQLDVHQQISQFVPTTNGVNNTPTLITRELQTQVTAKEGEIIVIGGLDEDRAISNDSGISFLPSWLWSKRREGQKTEIVLMLQLERI